MATNPRRSQRIHTSNNREVCDFLKSIKINFDDLYYLQNDFDVDDEDGQEHVSLILSKMISDDENRVVNNPETINEHAVFEHVNHNEVSDDNVDLNMGNNIELNKDNTNLNKNIGCDTNPENFDKHVVHKHGVQKGGGLDLNLAGNIGSDKDIDNHNKNIDVATNPENVVNPVVDEQGVQDGDEVDLIVDGNIELGKDNPEKNNDIGERVSAQKKVIHSEVNVDLNIAGTGISMSNKAGGTLDALLVDTDVDTHQGIELNGRSDIAGPSNVTQNEAKKKRGRPKNQSLRLNDTFNQNLFDYILSPQTKKSKSGSLETRFIF